MSETLALLLGSTARSWVYHGVAIGWLRTLTESDQILGPLVMGALADAVHLSASFLLAALLLLAIAWRWYQHAGEHPAEPSIG